VSRGDGSEQKCLKDGGLPPYQEAILSSEDLVDIHAWLRSLPKAQDYKSIPLLNPPA
jgi:hypothetical protein